MTGSYRIFAFIAAALCVATMLSGYSYAECPDSISSYWMMDETGGGTYVDYLAANNASCAGSCPDPVVNGKIYGGQLFNGATSGLVVPAASSFNWTLNSSFSIEYWIKKEPGTLNGEEVIVGRYDSAGNLQLKAGIGAGGHALFVLIANNGDGSSSEHYLNGTTNLIDTAWHHIVMMRDAGANKNILYVDGAVEDSKSVSYTAGFESLTVDLTIGWLQMDSGYHYQGILDETATYNRALSDTEISQHYSDGIIGLNLGYCGCARQLNIMPLGDSITNGWDASVLLSDYWVGYRQKLNMTLINRGYNIDLVGTMQTGILAIPAFDIDHEGHNGWRDDEIAANIYNWLVLNPADIILLHIGTNGLSASPDDVEDILDNIDLYSEDIVVVLARIINRSYYSSTTTLFNDNVAAMATTRIANGDRIIIVDQESALTYPDDLSDNLHPNSIGYGKMADVWLDSLDDFLPVCNLAAPAIISTPVTDGAENSPYSYDVVATGSMPMTYALPDSPDPVPAGMIIDQRTGRIEWVPSSIGDYNITVRAANSEGTDDQSFTIHVTPPVLDSLEVQGPVSVDENTSVDYNCVAHYSDGSSQTVEADTWSVDCPLIAGITATGLLSANEISEDEACTITATYTDGVTRSNAFPISITGNKLIITNSVPIAATHPLEGSSGIVMQRFQVDSGPVENGQVELASLNLVDHGTASSILDAKVYISVTALSALPPDAVLIGNTGVWDGLATVITLSGGPVSDRTVINGTSKYIYIIYDLADGQAGSTIQSNVTATGVASPDPVTGAAGLSNHLTIQTCAQNGSISILPGQTLYGNPVDLTSIVSAENVTGLYYDVSVVSGGVCDIDPEGTYIEAEYFTGTISQGTGTLVLENSQAGYLGTGYLRSNGGSSASNACPSLDEGKQYQVKFNQTGTYYVWMRGYASGGTSDSIFVGLDGTCAGSLIENGVYSQWVWSKKIKNGTNTINITTPGIHTINIWIREPDHLIDGIYITQGTEAPTNDAHGIEVNPNYCPVTVFSGDAAQAQSVDTAIWSEGDKTLSVSGDDITCGTPLFPASEIITYNVCNDNDNDGYGSPGRSSCPNGIASDCNDSDDTIYPEAAEICDGVDNDCDGSVDENLTSAYYEDLDGDTYGNPSVLLNACTQPIDYVLDNTDCNDTDPEINPLTYWYPDFDMDGYGNPAISLQQCAQPPDYLLDNTDCDDNDPEIHPGGSPVRITTDMVPLYYPSLQEAYNVVSDGESIQCQDIEFNENISINAAISVILEAGYNCDYSDNNGITTITGNMTVSEGVITIQSGTLKIQ